MTTDDRYGSNLRAEPIHVLHSALTRCRSSDSPYRSRCPVCDTGVLFVLRNQTTLQLRREDRCMVCGQAVVYDDAVINGEPLEAAK